MCGHSIMKLSLCLQNFFINLVGGCLAWALVRGEPVGQVSRSRKLIAESKTYLSKTRGRGFLES